ncbi:Tubulin-specific chaperone D, partial [Sesbania bispinosa]
VSSNSSRSLTPPSENHAFYSYVPVQLLLYLSKPGLSEIRKETCMEAYTKLGTYSVIAVTSILRQSLNILRKEEYNIELSLLRLILRPSGT